MLLLMFITLVLLFSIPLVQNKVGSYVTNSLNEDFGTNINIEKVGLKFNGDVSLKNIFIEDYKKDTLLIVKQLNTSVLSVNNILNNKLTFGDIAIEGLYLNIRTYQEERQTNLDVFVDKLDSEAPTTKSKTPFLLSSSNISIKESAFKLVDDNKQESNILNFSNLIINAQDFLILGPKVNATITAFSFYDTRGVTIKNLATDFSYSRSAMVFNDLSITTNASQIKGALTFQYEREDLQYFEDKVRITASFDNSVIALNELNTFYNEFGVDQVARVNVNLSGTLNDLKATQLNLKTSNKTIIDGDFVFKNLFNKSKNTFEMLGSFNSIASNYKDLTSLLPNILGKSIPSVMDKFGTFNMTGTTNITSASIDADLEIDTEIGYIIAELALQDINDIDNAAYKGNVIFDEFLMGRLVNNEKIGEVSFNVYADGKGFRPDNINTQVEGTIYGLNYNDYYYTNVTLNGNLRDKIFNGYINTKDDNLDLNFQGLVDFSEAENNYNFNAEVNHANLKVLNFVKNDSMSLFKGRVAMNMKGTTLDNAYGTIDFQNTLYTNEYDAYYFKDFSIASNFKNNERTLSVNSPEIIEGTMKGDFKLKEVVKLVENSLGNLYTNYRPYAIADDQNIVFNFKVYNKIAEVFYPGLNIGKNTFFKGSIGSNAEAFNLVFKSPEISIDEHHASNIELRLDNNNVLYNTYFQIENVNSKTYNVSDFNLINVTLKDSLFIRTEFNGGKNLKDRYDLNLFYTINEDNKSVLGFKKSNITFKNNAWFINEFQNSKNKVVFDREFNTFDFQDVSMTHQDELIKLSGNIVEADTKNLNLSFQEVHLSKVTPDIENLTLQGSIDGFFKVQQQNGNYIPESELVINNFKVNDIGLGDFRASIVGNETLTNYDVNIGLKEDTNQLLSMVGNLDFGNANSTIDIEVNLDNFTLESLNPFGDDVINQMRGFVTGNARVYGNLSKPAINGALILDKGGLAIPYLNVNYGFRDNTLIQLAEQSFILDNALITETKFLSEASLSGRINHKNFSNWSLNLDLDSDKLLVLNTEDSEEALYYGTAFVDGNISIQGPTNKLIIKAEVSTEEGTVFKIPLNDTESLGDNSFMHFLTPKEKLAKQRGEVLIAEDITGLEMDFDLSVNENAEIEIVIDKNSGSTIKGRGNGGLLAQINTNGRFNMYGDFLVSEGTYNFMYGGVIQKDFKVVQGGSLVWEGDPLQAEINIEAILGNINSNPSILLDNPINQSIPVEVKIHLTEKLELPTLDFDLLFPNVNSTLKSELEYRLSDTDTKQFQALSLMATGAFRSELTFDSQDALGLVSGRVTNMLNDIISSDNGKLDLGLNFELGENNPDYVTDSRVGVTLSTKLSDRVLINGKVGVPIGGVNETVIAGDFEIEVLLNEDRTLSLKFFNRENSIQNFGEQIGYTQGLGLSYNVEFNNLNELFKRLFEKKTTSTLTSNKSTSNEDESSLSEYNRIKNNKL